MFSVGSRRSQSIGVVVAEDHLEQMAALKKKDETGAVLLILGFATQILGYYAAQ